MTQRTWRLIGLVSIVIAGGMALHGARTLSVEQSPGYLLVYWGIFLFFLVTAMYVAILDARFIRLQYIAGQREIYKSTLAEEEFRRNLVASLEARDRKNSGATGNGSGE